MKKELLIGLGILALSQLAFTPKQRREIGNKAGWQCERPGCRKTFFQGWAMEVNHKQPLYNGGKDVVSNGELLCQEHHAQYHDWLGDGVGNAIRGRMIAGGRSLKWIKEHLK